MVVDEKGFLERTLMAPWTIDHESIWEAILADLADVVPVIGELAGLVRIAQAYESKDYLRLALETGDLLAGFPPLIGDILDLLTPTNLIYYLTKKEKG
jgi:hypothetical protein